MIEKSKNSLFLLLSIVALVGLSGCARYKVHPLPRLKPTQSSFINTKSVHMAYHVFTAKDCKTYLDRNVIAQGYQPIHITITNSSNHSMQFSLKNFSLPTVPVKKVAKQVHTNTGGRAAVYGFAALFMWPFAIPAIVDGIGSAEANEKLNADFKEKALRDQMLDPFETINGLVFVPVESFDSNFKIALTESKTAKPIVLSADKPCAQIPYMYA